MQTRRLFLAAAGASCLLAAIPRAVVQVRIAHVPNRVRTRAALSPHEVDAQASVVIETRNRDIVAKLLRAFEQTPRSPSPVHGDLRYAITFEDPYGRPVHRVYFDAFGRRGIVDGERVLFERNDLERALIAAYPALSQ